jgi:hypothetical protein
MGLLVPIYPQEPWNGTEYIPYTHRSLGKGQYISPGALEWDSIYTHRSLGMGQYLSHIVYIILLYQMKYHRRGVFEVLPALELSPQGYKC